MLSRLVSRRFAGNATKIFQQKPGILQTPPRFVDRYFFFLEKFGFWALFSMETKATTWWTILGIVGFYTFLIVYNETGSEYFYNFFPEKFPVFLQWDTFWGTLGTFGSKYTRTSSSVLSVMLFQTFEHFLVIIGKFLAVNRLLKYSKWKFQIRHFSIFLY